MTLTLDGTFSGATTTGNVVTVTFSTTKTNDVIYFFASGNGNVASINITSVMDTAGLTWIKRAASNQIQQSFESWYAISPGILTNDIISVTWSAAPAGRITGAAVSGANTTTPFDTNSSFPALQYNPGSTSASKTITTNNPNCILLADLRGSNTSGATIPTGFTTLISGGANESPSYDIVSSGVSSFAATYSGFTSTQNTLIIDAIQTPGFSPSGSADPLWFGING